MRNLLITKPDLTKVKSAPYFVAMLSTLALSACDGSSGGGVSADQLQDTGNIDAPDDLNGAGDDLTDEVAGGIDGNDGVNVPGTPDDGQGGAEAVPSVPALGLFIDSVDRCSPIFEPLELVISQQLAQDEDIEGQRPNVSNLLTIDTVAGSALNLVSRTDEGINFEISRQDIATVTASIDDSTVTLFLAGYERENPDSFIMRKPANGGCMYAFKSEDFCTTGFSTTGLFSSSRNGASISALGCELTNPNDLPVIELPAD